jgi:hypothetical protein
MEKLMYGTAYHNSGSEKPVTQLACYTLTGLAIVLSALAFWEKGFVPAALMTTAFGAVSFLLAGAVNRVAEAIAKRHYVTAVLAVIMGQVCMCLEAGMTHYGLAHLNAQYAIAPAWSLWPISFGLSAFNVFSQYAFARDLKAQQPKPRIVLPARTQPDRWTEDFFNSDWETGLARVVDNVRKLHQKK